MTLVRVLRIGTGASTDPFRAPLPTYTTVVEDDGAGNMIVDVPPQDLPDGFCNQPGASLSPLPSGSTLTGLTADLLRNWQSLLKDRYGNTYSPQVR